MNKILKAYLACALISSCCAITMVSATQQEKEQEEVDMSLATSLPKEYLMNGAGAAYLILLAALYRTKGIETAASVGLAIPVVLAWILYPADDLFVS